MKYSCHRRLPTDQLCRPRYVSCDYRRLYPAGIGVNPADGGLHDDLVRDPALDGIDWVAACFPAVWYGKALEQAAIINESGHSSDLRGLYAGMASRMAAASGLVRIEQAIIHDSLIWAARREPALVYETHRYNDRPAAPLPDFRRLERALPLRQEPDADYLMLGSAGSSNYGHFLVDDLPRLAALDHLGRQRQIVLMTRYSPAIDAVRRQAVTALGGPGVEVEWLDRDTSYTVDGLFYCTPVSDHPWVKSPAALARAAIWCRRLIADGRSSHRRLFVARPQTGERDLLNRHSVEQALAERGFETVFPEQLTFVEQVRLFASASIVVGQMGAALTNIMFAARGCPVLFLAPHGWIEPFYWDLAQIGGHCYSVLFGLALGEEVATHQRCFSIDVEKMERWCDMTIKTGGNGRVELGQGINL